MATRAVARRPDRADAADRGVHSRHGAVPAIQLAHAGRKGSMQRPWFGNGALDAADRARGDLPWQIVAPAPIAMDEGSLIPHALSEAERKALREQWRLATLRAVEAGFEMLEVHCAHGYLLHEFLSPLSNPRTDGYGGDLAGRMRFPLEIIETVRAAWPADKPLSYGSRRSTASTAASTSPIPLRSRSEAKAARRRRDRLLVRRPDGIGDGGADSARLRFSGAVCASDPKRGRHRHHGGRSHPACAAGRGRCRAGTGRPGRGRPRSPVRSELAAACATGARAGKAARCLRTGRSNTAGGWNAASPACASSTARRCRSGRGDLRRRNRQSTAA